VALEDHYDERVDTDRFWSALERLVDGGVVEREVDGIHDVYVLTGPGRDRLDEHCELMTAKVA